MQIHSNAAPYKMNVLQFRKVEFMPDLVAIDQPFVTVCKPVRSSNTRVPGSKIDLK